MKIEKQLFIPRDKALKYREMMQAASVSYEDNDIPEFSLQAVWTVGFGNGYEIDLKVCSSEDDAPLWCEAVLFLNGCEVACSDVDDDLIGTWTFEANDCEFVLTVQEEI